LTIDGLVTRATTRTQQSTVARVLASLSARNVPLIARIDHRAAGASAGLSLPPTEVLIFGNPKSGTRLMQAAPSIALDLPLRLLVQTVDGITRLSYNDPAWLAARHNLPGTTTPTILAMRELLAAIVADAI
jgi:uncharacterized protein (DUF302 family)